MNCRFCSKYFKNHKFEKYAHHILTKHKTFVSHYQSIIKIKKYCLFCCENLLEEKLNKCWLNSVDEEYFKIKCQYLKSSYEISFK